MHKVLISMPDQLASRLRATVPARQRSKIITLLIEKEVARRERKLYECALAVEQDAALNRDLKDWDATIGDGLDDESW
jgi:tRNA/tmRNA/rRNA uracil-C5-methylase (TrmA/RlmC/RlmD family)